MPGSEILKSLSYYCESACLYSTKVVSFTIDKAYNSTKEKKMKKITSYMKLFIAAFAFTFLFAGTDIVNAQTVATDANLASVDALDTHYVTTGTQKDTDQLNSFFITGDGQTGMPIKIDKKGGLFFGVAAGTTDYTSVEIYSDAACSTTALATAYIREENYDSGMGMYFGQAVAYIEKPGTYYVKVSDTSTILFMSQLYSGDNRNLKDKTWTAAYSEYGHKEIYYKYVPKKNGYISVSQEFIDLEGNGTGYAYISLLNSKKKAITDTVYTSTSNDTNKAVFSVKKGSTYYVKVEGNSAYRIKSVFTAVSENSGATKAKAKTLKFGKEAKGLILAEDKTSKVDYYKFTLTSAGKPTLVLKGNATGTIYLDIIGNNIYGGTGYGKINTYDVSASSKIELSDGRKLPKGTYYIKIYKDYDKDACGNYSIKIKK